MKVKKYVLFCIGFAAILLWGCGDTNDTINTIESVEKEETQEINVEENSTIVDKIEEVIEYTEDLEREKVFVPLTFSIEKLEDTGEMSGCQIHKIECEYIVIENPNNNVGIDTLNDIFYEDALAMMEEYATYAQESHEILEENFNSGEEVCDKLIEYTNKIEVKYNDRGILSVINVLQEQDFRYNEEKMVKFATTYDINTGEILYIKDILKKPEKELKEIITNAFLESNLIDRNIKVQYEQELLDNVEYADFYLDNRGMILFYESGSVLPDNIGEVSARIDYDTGYFDEFFERKNNEEIKTNIKKDEEK